MKKRIAAMILVIAMMLSLLPVQALAADSETGVEVAAGQTTDEGSPDAEGDGEGEAEPELPTLTTNETVTINEAVRSIRYRLECDLAHNYVVMFDNLVYLPFWTVCDQNDAVVESEMGIYNLECGTYYLEIDIEDMGAPADATLEGLSVCVTPIHNYDYIDTRTCTDGNVTYQCVQCDASYQEQREPLGHDYLATLTPATEEEAGATTFTCVRCGDSYSAAYNYGEALQTGECGENATWACNADGVLTISGTGAMDSSYGYPWKDYSSIITSVCVESGITYICAAAFSNMKNVTAASLPDTLTGIGQNAFSADIALEEIVVPDSVTWIGNAAFMGCVGLTAATLSSNINDLVYSEVFSGCTALARVSLPENLESIPYHTFYNCTALTSISLPENLEYIGGGAFQGSGLTAIEIPGSVSHMAGDTFNDCTSLVSAVYNCHTAAYYEYYDVNVGFSGCTALQSVQLPDTLSSISWGAFSGCSSLAAIDIPESVSTISSYAFNGCTALETIDLPASVHYINDGTFQNCSSLREVNLDQVTTIYDSAFENCSSLTAVELCETLTRIGSNAFYGTGLTEVTVPAITSIGDNALGYNDDGKIEGFVIKGYSGTAAESYANANEIVFESLGEACCSGSYENISWSLALNDGVLTISGAGDMPDFGWCDAPWYAYRNYITEIEVEEGITSIGQYAFMDLSSAAEVNLPSSLCRIAYGAFQDCDALQSIVIPAGVTKLGGSTFQNCDALQSIVIPDGVTELGGYVFENCYALQSVVLPANITRLGYGLFEYCNQLTEVVLPENLERIENSAFYGCSALSSITLPDTLTYIGSQAFCSTALTEITVPASVQTIEYHALGYNYYGEKQENFVINGYSGGIAELYASANEFEFISLGEITIGGEYAGITWSVSNGVLTISGAGDMPDFGWCDAPWYAYRNYITEIEVEEGITSIGQYAFMDLSSAAEVNLPSSLCRIAYGAFQDCEALQSIVIPDGVTELSYYVFENCYALQSVVLPANITRLGYGLFEYCNQLTEVVLPENLERIESSAFYGCSALSSITLPDTLTYIGSQALGSTALTEITVPASVQTIEYHALGYNYDEKQEGFVINGYSYSAAMFYAEDNEFSFNSLGAINPTGHCNLWNENSASWSLDVESGVLVLSGTGDIAFDQGTSSSIYPYRDYITSIVIMEGINYIGSCAFKDLYNLVSVSLPESLYGIGSYAFADCFSLQTITLPQNINWINVGAFSNCVSLTEIVLPSGGHYGEIEAEVFLGCEALEHVTIPSSVSNIHANAFYGCTALSAIQLPDNLGTVGVHAFFNTGLQEIAIPGTVATIGEQAFGYCRDYVYDGSDWSSELTAIEGFTVYGYSNSVAERYAADNGFAFVSTGNGSLQCGYNMSWSFDAASATLTISGSGQMYGYDDNRIPWAGYREDIRYAVVDDGITSLSGSLFKNCTALESIVLPDTLNGISSYMFYGCENLRSVTIPESARYIGYAAFSGCVKLENAVIPSGVMSIEEEAFNNCKSLQLLKVPASVTSIGCNTFENCSRLTILYAGSRCRWNKTGVMFSKVKCTSLHDWDEGKVTKEATSTETGILTYTCAGCGTKKRSVISVAFADTDFTFTLSQNSFTYNGEAKEPKVYVKDANGDKLVCGTDFSVAYENNIEVGTANAVVTGLGKYAGVVSVAFTIKPAATTLEAVCNPAGNALTVTWKPAEAVDGYVLKFATNSTFSGAYTRTVEGQAETAYTLNNRSVGKRYYVRVQTYKVVDGVTYYSAWSDYKSAYVVPPVEISSVESDAAAKKVTVSWDASTYKIDGYEIKMYTNANCTTLKKSLAVDVSESEITFSNCTPGKTYYVRMRSYKIISSGTTNETVYSEWSTVCAVTVS